MNPDYHAPPKKDRGERRAAAAAASEEVGVTPTAAADVQPSHPWPEWVLQKQARRHGSRRSAAATRNHEASSTSDSATDGQPSSALPDWVLQKQARRRTAGRASFSASNASPTNSATNPTTARNNYVSHQPDHSDQAGTSTLQSPDGGIVATRLVGDSSSMTRPGAVAVPGVRGTLEDSYSSDESSENEEIPATRPDSIEAGLPIAAHVVDDENAIEEVEDRVRNQIISGAPKAEVVEENHQRQRWLINRIAIGLFLVTIVGVAAPTGVVLSRRGDTSVVVNATSAPTLSAAPTGSPTDAPSLLPSIDPSESPTLSPTSPDNEQCDEAVPLVQDRVYSGDLYMSNASVYMYSCGPLFETQKPRWYSAPAQDSSAIRLCSRFDFVRWSIFPECVPCDSDSDSGCGLPIPRVCSLTQGFSTSVQQNQPDCLYQRIYVPSANEVAMLSSNLFILLGLPPTWASPEPIENLVNQSDYAIELTQDFFYCQSARPLNLISAGQYTGSTTRAPKTISDEFFPCLNSTVNRSIPGVWYKIDGKDQFIHITAMDCTNKFSSPNSAVAVTVLKGKREYSSWAYETQCTGSECLEHIVDACVEPLSFWARNDTTYLLLVQPSPVGDFVLSSVVQDRDVICEGSILIDPSEVVSGAEFEHKLENPWEGNQTRLALFEECDMNQGYTGVWYRFLGTGKIVEIDGCSFSVLVGNDCDSLQCVYSSTESICNTTKFQTDVRFFYYIHVRDLIGNGNTRFRIASVEDGLNLTVG